MDSSCMLCGCKVDSGLLQVHINACLDDEETKKSDALVATLAVDEVIDVDASAPLGGVSSVSASNVVNVEPSSPVRKRPRAQGVSKGAVEDGPPPLLVSSGIPNGAAGAVGMNVLNNVSGRMAEQFSIDKVKGLSSFHLSSHFDLYSTTVSGTGWDCGYRNTMMFISSLLREDTMIGPMLARSGVTAVPCIENIQARIEAAWRRGFDVDGALFYRHRLVGKSGSESWIGAVEICCLLRGMGLRALVADFEKTKSASGNHQELLDWVLNYFDTRCRAGGCLKCRNTFFGRAGSFICPLILQHQGHSRTIAGVEKRMDGRISLLVCDPLRSFADQLRDCEARGLGMAPMMRRVRVGLAGLKEEAYQIVHMPLHLRDMVLTTVKDYEASKVVVCTRREG